ncbi:sugar kinase [Streptomyces sp. DSM 40473]|uniref:Sugar kinase n=2 Tax=Streptomyces hesseae TaxID=3075519 RepID=A0ABU2STZ6_9ACTN|nr:sugar kinase [Streptomyces sp. DSM 40473]MDT0452471.1 sugar kinase [Streptomyces sp. DSM 40473]
MNGPDVVCLGESMVVLRPGPTGAGRRLADVPSFDRGIGGAESNVACVLAGRGHPTRWISRVGADAFGTHLVAAVAAHGVDTTYVQRDPVRPTGVYFRTAGERPTTSGTIPDPSYGEAAYYRAGSAASAMSPALIPRAAAHAGRILHLTGITAALSADCLALLRELVVRAPGSGPLLSFDVNYRAALWRHTAPEDPRVLAELARACDIVFVGEDEAEAAWGIDGGPDAIRAALPEPAVLVVKQGAAGATAYTRDARDARDAVVSVPAPAVDVVAPVGAGDAFAAGFLSATLRGLPLPARLRYGHLMAAAALTVPGDLGEPPPPALADTLAGLDPAAWGRLRLGPGWTGRLPAQAVEPCTEDPRT